MTHTFTAHFAVRQYELNSVGELPNSALQRLFQETATLATRDAGYGIEWFSERRSVWVIHQMTLAHLRPIRYPDELAITTWLSDTQKVRTHREYLARNATTGEMVARGRAHWVHLHSETLLPLRLPADLIERFQPNGLRAIPRIEPRAYPASQLALPEHRVPRRTQRYEADAMRHVNNAVYLDWLEEALADAVAAHPALRSAPDAKRLCVYRHDLEYVKSAVPGDAVEIVVNRVGVGKTASAWSLRIVCGEDLLVRDHITALWVNSAGKPARNRE